MKASRIRKMTGGKENIITHLLCLTEYPYPVWCAKGEGFQVNLLVPLILCGVLKGKVSK